MGRNHRGDHIGRQARDTPVTDDHRTSRVPHHLTMVNGQGLDVALVLDSHTLWPHAGQPESVVVGVAHPR